MKNDILLSIIICCYNSEKFLEKTLTMLVSQGLEDTEIIIVNDGSSDSTKIIAEKFAEKYQQFKIFTHCEKGIWQSFSGNPVPGSIINRGQGLARNTGLQFAQGKYIYFFDSDDTLTYGTLDYFRETLSKNPHLDAFVFGYDMVSDGVKEKKYVMKNSEPGLADSFFEKYITKKEHCCICSVIFANIYLQRNKIEFYKQRTTGEDIAFLVSAFAFANNVYYSNRICFRYQIRNDSLMQGYKKYGLFHTTGILVVKKTIEDLIYQKPEYEEKLNFFLAMYYVYNLKLYLIAQLPDIEAGQPINTLFIDNKYLLKRKLSGKFSLRCIIFFLKLFPLNVLFKLFGK